MSQALFSLPSQLPVSVFESVIDIINGEVIPAALPEDPFSLKRLVPGGGRVAKWLLPGAAVSQSDPREKQAEYPWKVWPKGRGPFHF